MLKTIILLVATATAAFAQNNNPQCLFRFTLTSTGPTSAIDNTGTSAATCQEWSVSTIATGFTSLNLQLEQEQSMSGPWSAVASGIIYGLNPMTSITTGGMAVNNGSPFLRLNLLSAAGTGQVQVTLIGWENFSPPPAQEFWWPTHQNDAGFSGPVSNRTIVACASDGMNNTTGCGYIKSFFLACGSGNTATGTISLTTNYTDPTGVPHTDAGATLDLGTCTPNNTNAPILAPGQQPNAVAVGSTLTYSVDTSQADTSPLTLGGPNRILSYDARYNFLRVF